MRTTIWCGDGMEIYSDQNIHITIYPRRNISFQIRPGTFPNLTVISSIKHLKEVDRW